jgi:asparagine synthase (glutamine-hydrolysing)
MPGIAGIIGTPFRRENGALLDMMASSLVREEFHRGGKYVNEELGAWVGWTCQKGSFSDCMPIWNEDKNICLICTGEVFPDKAEVQGLRSKGHQFEFQNASYLVHQYEEKGTAFLNELNGWFGGVLLDLRSRKTVLFNDRYGLGRIYLHEKAGNLFFASEAKCLLRVLPEVRQIDFQSLAEVCSCGCALQNRSLFSGVSLLPGASKWTFSPSQPPAREVYFRKEMWEEQPLLDEPQYYEQFKETFARILPRYCDNGRQIGMSLTGGLDGRMIMAWARRPPGTMPCYTFGGLYRDCADVTIARKVARTCDQPHQVIPVNGRFFSEFPGLAERAVYISDGAMDVTGSLELYVNRLAREIAPVRLTGNYGSEILRSNVAFKPGFTGDGVFEGDFARQVEAVAATYAQELHGHRLSFIAFKQVPWHHFSRLSVEQSQLTLRSPYLDNDLVRLGFQGAPRFAASKETAMRFIADGNPSLSRIQTDRGVVRNSAPAVACARRLYQELTFKAEYAFDVGMPQWLAKVDHALAPLRVDKLFLGRHKFHHFRVWYRDRLASFVKDVLLDPRTRGRPYLRGAVLEKMVQGHVRGDRNYTMVIHKVLTTELIQRQLIERAWSSFGGSN